MPDAVRSAQLPPRLVLTGFMGSGKTTVGRALATRVGWSFVDLDDHVAAHEGETVPTLIASRGEAAFRQAECAALRNLLHRSNIVIALGGGAPETPEVRALLQNGGTCVAYLQSPFEVLYRRCVAQAIDPRATSRPLLGDPASTRERYERRLPLYEALAHIVVPVQEDSPEDIAAAILAKLLPRTVSR